MRLRWLAFLPLPVLAAWSIAAHPWGWLYALGVHPYPGPQTPWTYQLESGFLPALTVLTLLGALVSLYRLHVCHYETCWHLGRHRLNGSPWCNAHRHYGEHDVSDHHLLEQILGALNHQSSVMREMLREMQEAK